MTYVALLRGIGPSNPNMHPQKLKSFFENLGFRNVHTVIASGNVIFDSPSQNVKALEAKIEKALPLKLGFSSVAIVRSRAELEALVKKNPFKGVKDEKPSYLVVTFFKDPRKELCTVIDMKDDTNAGGKFMLKLERVHGKALTTRTWKTVQRILKKMGEVHPPQK